MFINKKDFTYLINFLSLFFNLSFTLFSISSGLKFCSLSKTFPLNTFSFTKLTVSLKTSLSTSL